MPVEPEITAKDDVSSRSEEDNGGGATSTKQSDDDEGNGTDADVKKEDPLMNASDVILSMRKGIEDSLRHNVESLRSNMETLRKIEPPMPFFRRPLQRQHWGDIQHDPHKEWGDIFFDLFYVAGAYNLGNLIREEPTKRGLLYFCACFFPLQSLWQYKMYWDARFYTPTRDMYHQLYELCTLVVLATAVLNIRPVAILSDPEEHGDLFMYCLAVSVGMFLVIGRSIEVKLLIENEPAAVVATKREAIMYGFMTLFFVAATIYSGVKHFGGNQGGDSYYNSALAETSHGYGESTNDIHNATSDPAEDNHHFLFRFLAGASSYGEEDNNYSGDVVMALLLAGCGTNHIIWFLFIWFWATYGGDHTRVTVPMNIGYAIHRYGEWTMLMLGETVLSLLVVGAYNVHGFQKIVYCGIITITLLNTMHFRSQPHHADDHAMRRKKERAFLFLIFHQLYSAALILMGASYKMLLYEYVYEVDYAAEAGYGSDANYAPEGQYESEYGGDDDVGYGNATTYDSEFSHGDDDGHRSLLVVGSKLHRLLAGGGGGALRFDKDERLQRIANLFCGSMAAVFLLCDLLIVVHKGIKEHMDQCKERPASKFVKLLGVPLLLIRVGLVVFMATLSQYATDPSYVAFIGMICVVVQLMLRIVGTYLYRNEDDEDDEYKEILKNGVECEKSMAFQPEDDSD